ncbi:hypothetical protein EVAR_62972_1 [Eumeta japonica]|uniref:Uncharacterized protein n=1 Tax=Eumeta variegata TaxID=151549 RepID=A0A4C1ZDD4_EUMVA|nr:hypothetical protein EVAR_62972_1 [Eumeta japonica]
MKTGTNKSSYKALSFRVHGAIEISTCCRNVAWNEICAGDLARSNRAGQRAVKFTLKSERRPARCLLARGPRLASWLPKCRIERASRAGVGPRQAEVEANEI